MSSVMLIRSMEGMDLMSNMSKEGMHLSRMSKEGMVLSNMTK